MWTQSRLAPQLPSDSVGSHALQSYLYRFVGVLLCTSLKTSGGHPSDLQHAMWACMLNLTSVSMSLDPFICCSLALCSGRKCVQCYSVLPVVS